LNICQIYSAMLPEDIIWHILTYADYLSLVRWAGISKKFKERIYERLGQNKKMKVIVKPFARGCYLRIFNHGDEYSVFHERWKAEDAQNIKKALDIYSTRRWPKEGHMNVCRLTGNSMYFTFVYDYAALTCSGAGSYSVNKKHIYNILKILCLLYNSAKSRR
jgi:hypothetical protein